MEILYTVLHVFDHVDIILSYSQASCSDAVMMQAQQ